MKSLGLIIALTLSLTSFSVYADEGELPESQITPNVTSRDPRMPPVVPGEVVTTENGDKIKVWSSSGPVYVDHPPVDNSLPNGSVPYGVIVDQRRGH